MITKIQPALPYTNRQVFPPRHENKFQEKNSINSYNPELFKNYFISFTGKKPGISKKDFIDDNITPYGQELMDDSFELAKKYNHAEVNNYHVIRASLQILKKYIEEMNDNKRTFSEDVPFEIWSVITDMTLPDVFKTKTQRDILLEIINEQIKIFDETLKELPKNKSNSTPAFSKDLINDIYSTYLIDKTDDEDEKTYSDERISDATIFNAALFPYTEKYNKLILPLKESIKNAFLIDNTPLEKRLHLSAYDNKAKTLWKNLNYGINTVVLHENDDNYEYLITSFLNIMDKSENGVGKFNKDNTQITILDRDFQMNFIEDKLEQFSKDKDKNHIVIIDITDYDLKSLNVDETNYDIFLNTPSNIKFIFIANKDLYYKNITGEVEKLYNNMGEITIPLLNTVDAKKAFKENPMLYKSTGKEFSPTAVQKCVELSSQMPGVYPQKAIKLMDKIAKYYMDRKEINLNDVQKYYNETKDIFKNSNNESAVEIIFDTNQKLKDIIGKSNTKKEAENIIKQIKSNKLGTKGLVIYSQDGSPGAGRKHTVQVIAGESHSPFISINAVDFGTKEVDLFGGENLSPEASMRKLFSLVTAQADTNSHKSAVLFIQNFEYFLAGEYVSEYHEKAMAQLIREMNNLEKKGYNILIAGSVSRPDMIGEAAMKSFKFTDSIEVSSPAYNENERFEILKYTFKKNNLKLKGTHEQQDKILKDTSKTLEEFSFIELKAFVKKAETVALERNHKEITKDDLIESYLRITSGRSSFDDTNLHEKEITTKHECGHALTLTVLNELMSKSNKPWNLPDKVNFITLDPRGIYGGAMFHKRDENRNISFENMFSDIVCCYGGHSAEKYFYGMDGSWGISGDLEHATRSAQLMASRMGQGHYIGKVSLQNLKFNLNSDFYNKIYKDIDVITRNALTVSDMIVENYADFINEFSERYSHLVGTGDCLIDGDTFREEFANWKSKQSNTKLQELETLDNMILDAIKATKNGKIY